MVDFFAAYSACGFCSLGSQEQGCATEDNERSGSKLQCGHLITVEAINQGPEVRGPAGKPSFVFYDFHDLALGEGVLNPRNGFLVSILKNAADRVVGIGERIKGIPVRAPEQNQ